MVAVAPRIDMFLSRKQLSEPLRNIHAQPIDKPTQFPSSSETLSTMSCASPDFVLSLFLHHGEHRVSDSAEPALPAVLQVSAADKALAPAKHLLALRARLAARPKIAQQAVAKPRFAEGDGARPFLSAPACGRTRVAGRSEERPVPRWTMGPDEDHCSPSISRRRADRPEMTPQLVEKVGFALGNGTGAAETQTANSGQPPLQLSIFKAAMNASCGISTLPNWRIFFLPAFCFSSSLRLRVASPP